MKFLVGLLTFLAVIVGVFAFLNLSWLALLGVLVLLALWMLLTRRGRQAASVTGIGVSTLPQRLGSSAVIVVGNVLRGMHHAALDAQPMKRERAA